MNTTTAPAPTFATAMTEAQFFARHIEDIRSYAAAADYAWNATGRKLAEEAVKNAMKIHMVPATKANVAAALAYVSEGK